MKKAKVTVAIPVYNGANFLANAIESILNQTFKDLIIMIVDNCSVDNTKEICEYYLKVDERVEYFKNEENIGAANNFNLALDRADSEYFMWLAHDDYFHHEFLEKAVDFLEKNDNAVLCYSDLIFIDEYGRKIEEYSTLKFGANLKGNIINWLTNPGGYELYGLYRLQKMKHLRSKEIYGPDVIWILELLFCGDLIKISEPLFYYRQFKKTPQDLIESIATNQESRDSMNKSLFLSMVVNMWKVIEDSNLSELDKKDILSEFIDIITTDYTWLLKLKKELLLLGNGVILEKKDLKKVLKKILLSKDISFEKSDISNDKLRLCNREKFIWGTGRGGEEILQIFNQIQVSVEGFIDSNISKKGNSYLNHIIYDPSILIDKKHIENKPYVIIGSMYMEEISDLLLDFGYELLKDFI